MNKYRLSLQRYVIAVGKEKVNWYVSIVGYFLIPRIRDSTYTVGLSGWLSMCKGTELRGTQRACSVSQTHFTPTVALTQLAALVSAEHDPGVYLDNNTAVQQTNHPRCTFRVPSSHLSPVHLLHVCNLDHMKTILLTKSISRPLII